MEYNVFNSLLGHTIGEDNALDLVFNSELGETEFIRNIDGHWRIRSANTGELWPQKYDSAESAHAALSAYHAG